MKSQGIVIESRDYNTVYGVWTYFTADDGQIELEKSDYLLIGTLESYKGLRDYYGKEKIIPLYIEADDGDRLLRAIKREKSRKRRGMRKCAEGFWQTNRIFARKDLQSAA